MELLEALGHRGLDALGRSQSPITRGLSALAAKLGPFECVGQARVSPTQVDRRLSPLDLQRLQQPPGGGDLIRGEIESGGQLPQRASGSESAAEDRVDLGAPAMAPTGESEALGVARVTLPVVR